MNNSILWRIDAATSQTYTDTDRQMHRYQCRLRHLSSFFIFRFAIELNIDRLDIFAEIRNVETGLRSRASGMNHSNLMSVKVAIDVPTV